MRIAAQWAYSEAGWDQVADDQEPAWIGIGFITAEAGGLLLLIALILGWIGSAASARAAAARCCASAASSRRAGVGLRHRRLGDGRQADLAPRELAPPPWRSWARPARAITPAWPPSSACPRSSPRSRTRSTSRRASRRATPPQPPDRHAARDGDRAARRREAGALYYALLLKDAGCSSNAARVARCSGPTTSRQARAQLVDWTRADRGPALRPHGRRAARLAAAAGRSARARGGRARPRQRRPSRPAASAARRSCACWSSRRPPPTAVRSLDEHWNGKGQPDGLRGEAIPLLARIACLAQTVEVFHHDRGVDGGAGCCASAAGAGSTPRWSTCCSACPTATSCGGASARTSAPATDLAPDDGVLVADDERLDRIAEAFAQVIDAKSPYTFSHSSGVADYRRGDRRAGSATGRTRRATAPHGPAARHRQAGRLQPHPRQAGAAHGRRVRPGPPPPGRHSEILCASRPSPPGGRRGGAPRADRRPRLPAAASPATPRPRNARILAVADVFEALSADRPYRGALPVDEALALMRRDVGTAFCPRAFGALESALAGPGLALAA